MKTQQIELQQLKGIGKVLSRRLCESSYVSIAKVASANEKGLGRITGMTPSKAHAISLQARQLTGQAEKSHHTWSDASEAADQQVAQETMHRDK